MSPTKTGVQIENLVIGLVRKRNRVSALLAQGLNARILKARYIYAITMKSFGYNKKDLEALGYRKSEVQAAFKPKAIPAERRILQKIGPTPTKPLISVLFMGQRHSAEELKHIGYSAKELSTFFSPKALIMAGFSQKEVNRAFLEKVKPTHFSKKKKTKI